MIAHRPGRQIRFAFDRAEGIEGHHAFTVGEGSSLRHELVVTRAPLGLMAAVMPMHDALLDDLLEQAEAAVTGRRVRRGPFSPAVRALRELAD